MPISTRPIDLVAAIGDYSRRSRRFRVASVDRALKIEPHFVRAATLPCGVLMPSVHRVVSVVSCSLKGSSYIHLLSAPRAVFGVDALYK